MGHPYGHPRVYKCVSLSDLDLDDDYDYDCQLAVVFNRYLILKWCSSCNVSCNFPFSLFNLKIRRILELNNELNELFNILERKSDHFGSRSNMLNNSTSSSIDSE